MNKQTLQRVIFAGLFLVPFIPFLVSSSFFFPFIVFKAFTWRLIIEIIFVAWIVLALLEPEYRPRKSLVLYCLLTFLFIIGLADIFGVDPSRSFWSNFERMEGFISLLHLGAFFLVAGSMFNEELWRKWWNTSLIASFGMVIYGVFQLAGVLTINQGGVRVDGTFGNASYLAIYMLFHIFVALFLLYRDKKNTGLRWWYVTMIVLQTYILYHTATRGAILGFLGGLLVVSILNLRNRDNTRIRKASIIYVVSLLVVIGGFFVLRDSSFVERSPVLARFTEISSEELKGGGRSFVWPMAFEGIKDKPILGWGQDNFIYVFNEHYDARMFKLEPWFDRAHNVFLDWGIAGGILGLLAYLSLYFALLYLLWVKDDEFTHAEKSILTGLISAYFFHNLFVFDHLVSYILFFAVLAQVHSRRASAPEKVKEISVSRVQALYAPVLGILLVFTIYFVNIKPIRANMHLLSALSSLQGDSPNYERAMTEFRSAYTVSRLGQPEVVEQMSQYSTKILQSDLEIAERNDYFAFVRDAVVKLAEDFPNDTRYQLMAGAFFSATGGFEDALSYLDRAKELTPEKQQIYYETGSAYINVGELDKALEEFKDAYELSPDNHEAKVVYLIGAIYVGDRVLEQELLSELPENIDVTDRRILSAYVASKRASDAIRVLRKIGELNPEFKSQADEYVRQIQQNGL